MPNVPCPICGDLYDPKSLARHKRDHNGANVKVCPYMECPFSTRHAYALRIHLNTHTGDMPYSCKEPGCNYTARDPASVSRHRTLLNHLTNARPRNKKSNRAKHSRTDRKSSESTKKSSPGRPYGAAMASEAASASQPQLMIPQPLVPPGLMPQQPYPANSHQSSLDHPLTAEQYLAAFIIFSTIPCEDATLEWACRQFLGRTATTIKILHLCLSNNCSPVTQEYISRHSHLYQELQGLNTKPYNLPDIATEEITPFAIREHLMAAQATLPEDIKNHLYFALRISAQNELVPAPGTFYMNFASQSSSPHFLSGLSQQRASHLAATHYVPYPSSYDGSPTQPVHQSLPVVHDPSTILRSNYHAARFEPQMNPYGRKTFFTPNELGASSSSTNTYHYGLSLPDPYGQGDSGVFSLSADFNQLGLADTGRFIPGRP